jgi:hypothetical protein
MSTPLTGVGKCSAGGETAWTDNGNATVTGCSTSLTSCVPGGLVKLPQVITYATPAAPIPPPPTSDLKIGSKDNCSTLNLTSGCTDDGLKDGKVTLSPNVQPPLGNVELNGGSVTLTPGTYNINSISIQSTGSTLSTSGTTPVILNVAGANQNTPVDFTGGSVVNINSSNVPNPINLQIQYGGSGTVKLAGGAQTAAVVYAPNAQISLTGGSNFMGSLIGATVSDTGGTNIYYDRNLSKTNIPTLAAIVGNFMMDSFSWSRF